MKTTVWIKTIALIVTGLLAFSGTSFGAHRTEFYSVTIAHYQDGSVGCNLNLGGAMVNLSAEGLDDQGCLNAVRKIVDDPKTAPAFWNPFGMRVFGACQCFWNCVKGGCPDETSDTDDKACVKQCEGDCFADEVVCQAVQNWQ